MFFRKPPVEHPERIERFKAAIAVLGWTTAEYRASLNVLFNELSALVQAEIAYYYGRRCTSRRMSKVCRFLAWLLGAAGILVPLVHPILEAAPKAFLSWGYIAFATAGAALLFDSLFAGTTAHQRYTRAQLELEHIYQAFSLRWQRGLVSFDEQSSVAAVQSLIDEGKVLVEAFHQVLADETLAWKKDVDEGLSEMKAKVRSGGES